MNGWDRWTRATTCLRSALSRGRWEGRPSMSTTSESAGGGLGLPMSVIIPLQPIDRSWSAAVDVDHVMTTDDELVARVLGGETRVFALIVTRHQDHVGRVVARMLGD